MPVKYFKEYSQRYMAEFKNVNKDVLEWLETTAEENNCRTEKDLTPTPLLEGEGKLFNCY